MSASTLLGQPLGIDFLDFRFPLEEAVRENTRRTCLPIEVAWMFMPPISGYRLSLRVGAHDQYTRIVDGATVKHGGRHVLVDVANGAIEYVIHVRECVEGIRDLVDQ